jgi:hypothetical protein
MNYPLAHKIKRPYEYIRSEATDISVRFARIRDEQQARAAQPSTVTTMKRAAK